MNGRLAASPRGICLAAAGMVAAAGVAAVLFFFDPVTSGFYPVCMLHQTTGLLCPGCGTLRALHQLTHGNIGAALRLNFFAVALLPVAAWLGARELIWLTTGKRLPGIVTRPILAWVLLGVLIIFGVVRNLPLPHLLAMSH